MTLYVLAQITIRDRDRYEKYVPGFMATLAAHQGRLVAFEENPEVFEGTWDHEKVVLMAFDDRDTLDRWLGSADYQEMSKDRKASTDGVGIILNALPLPQP